MEYEYRKYTEEEISEAVKTIEDYCKNALEHADEISDEENEKLQKLLTEFNKYSHIYESMTKQLAKSSTSPKTKTPKFGKTKRREDIPGWKN